MKKLAKVLLIASLSGMVLTGCQTGDSLPNVYKRGELQKAHQTQFGTVLSLKKIQIQGEGNKILTVGGAALGALAAKNIGGGTGAIAAAVVGGLAGGYATDAITGKMNNADGIEFTVKLDNGRIVTFAQEGDVNRYMPNQRVKLVTSNGKTRVDDQ